MILEEIKLAKCCLVQVILIIWSAPLKIVDLVIRTALSQLSHRNNWNIFWQHTRHTNTRKDGSRSGSDTVRHINVRLQPGYSKNAKSMRQLIFHFHFFSIFNLDLDNWYNRGIYIVFVVMINICHFSKDLQYSV